MSSQGGTMSDERTYRIDLKLCDRTMQYLAVTYREPRCPEPQRHVTWIGLLSNLPDHPVEHPLVPPDCEDDRQRQLAALRIRILRAARATGHVHDEQTPEQRIVAEMLSAAVPEVDSVTDGIPVEIVESDGPPSDGSDERMYRVDLQVSGGKLAYLVITHHDATCPCPERHGAFIQLTTDPVLPSKLRQRAPRPRWFPPDLALRQELLESARAHRRMQGEAPEERWAAAMLIGAFPDADRVGSTAVQIVESSAAADLKARSPSKVVTMVPAAEKGRLRRRGGRRRR
jgi:hypothetical protein